jgi:hypothetical protein
MTRYDRVLEILETSVNQEPIGAHGNFWRNKTRDQFVALRVRGMQLITVGDAAQSSLIKALRGLAPFGQDLENPPQGALFPRMPASRPAVPELSIQFIEKWINDGCLEDEMRTAFGMQPAAPAPAMSPDAINTFFREFDQFFAFEADQQTSDAIDAFFAVAEAWIGIANAPSLPTWTSAISVGNVAAAAQFLSDNQLRVINKHFGKPADRAALNSALWQFGQGSLPADNLRPQDRLHRMNGSIMWLYWLAFADASIRLGSNAPQWSETAKSICLGMVGDALFRTDRPVNTRLKITRYRADDPGVRDKVIGDFAALDGNGLLDAIAGLGREARFGAPVA